MASWAIRVVTRATSTGAPLASATHIDYMFGRELPEHSGLVRECVELYEVLGSNVI